MGLRVGGQEGVQGEISVYFDGDEEGRLEFWEWDFIFDNI